jgi:hypothetical protein
VGTRAPRGEDRSARIRASRWFWKAGPFRPSIRATWASSRAAWTYLGPFLGVPTCAFYSLDIFNRVHLELLRRAERSLDAGGGDRESPAGYLLFDLHHLSPIDQLAGERTEARAHP